MSVSHPKARRQKPIPIGGVERYAPSSRRCICAKHLIGRSTNATNRGQVADNLRLAAAKKATFLSWGPVGPLPPTFWIAALVPRD